MKLTIETVAPLILLSADPDIPFETHLIFAHTYSIVLMGMLYYAGIFPDVFYSDLRDNCPAW